MARIEFSKCEVQGCPLESSSHGHFVLASGISMPVTFSSVEAAKKFLLDYLIRREFITSEEVVELENQMIKAGLCQKVTPSERERLTFQIMMIDPESPPIARFFEELFPDS